METLAGMAWFHSIVPIEELDRSFPAEEAPANRAYAEAYDFVGYLSRRGRYEDTADDGDREPFRVFLQTIAQTGSLDAAAVQGLRPAAARAVRRVARDAIEPVPARADRPDRPRRLGAVRDPARARVTRRRRQNRVRMAQWEREARAYDEMIARLEAERAALLREDEPPLMN